MIVEVNETVVKLLGIIPGLIAIALTIDDLSSLNGLEYCKLVESGNVPSIV